MYLETKRVGKKEGENVTKQANRVIWDNTIKQSS